MIKLQVTKWTLPLPPEAYTWASITDPNDLSLKLRGNEKGDEE
jgi:hypothetical protein